MRIEDAMIFLKLSELKNVRKASERLNLTQSAVSKVLQRLETEFDVVLAQRGPDGIVLTSEGTLLREKAEHLLASYDALRHEMQAARAARLGQIRIGTIPALLDERVLPLLAQLRKTRQDLRFQIKVKVSDELIEMVTLGELDLAICFMPDAAAPGPLQCERIAGEESHVVARKGHPLVSSREPSMEALSRSEWLLPAKTVAMRQWVDRSFVNLGLTAPVSVIETDASTAIYASLISDSDIVTAFLTATLRSRAMEGLVELPFIKASSEQSLTLLFRRSAYLSPAARELRELIHRNFSA